MASEISEHLLVSHEESITLLRLNRPEKKNALNVAMYSALVSALHQADANPKTRVIVITGSDTCFTSGNDVIDFITAPPTDPESPVMQFLQALHCTQKPLIAAVAGPAVGIGATMLLHCDLAYADITTKFRMPFVQLGLCPEAASSLLLPLQAGYHRAAEILLLGENFDAITAAEIGLINQSVAEGKALEKALEKARQMASLPPAALRASKALLRKAHGSLIQDTMQNEGAIFLERLRSPEFTEAVQAMIQKRDPDFSQFE